MDAMVQIKLKKGKDKAAWQLHPWVFSGAIDRIGGKPYNGELVQLFNAADEFIAFGMFNGESRVAVRLLEWNPEVRVDESWWRKRVERAVQNRAHLYKPGHCTTYRLIFSEADFLPGLIVDRYGDYLSVQVLNAGIERIKPLLVDELMRQLNPAGIYQRADEGARAHEGLEVSAGVLAGGAPPEFISVVENGVQYEVNILEGQKSGFYCDQRDNRRFVADYSSGKRVLDCFSYSGGFTLNCLQQGAESVTSVDSSALAIETLRRNVALNKFPELSSLPLQNDVNKQLRAFVTAGERFDIVILDPPKYAPTRGALEKASRAYKDLNRLGMALLESGGLLATFSCSAAMDSELFKQVIAWAALDAGKEVQFIQQFSQPADHPIRASFPQGEYLNGLLCRIL